MSPLFFPEELDPAISQQVQEELTSLNLRRIGIIIGVVFLLTLGRELAFLVLPVLIPFETGQPFAPIGQPFSPMDIVTLCITAAIFFSSKILQKKKRSGRLLIYLFLGVWILSIIVSLLLDSPGRFDYNTILTVFVNMILLNMFFHLHPVFCFSVNVCFCSALMWDAHRADNLTLLLVFAVISTLVFLVFMDINLYRTLFSQVYYKVQYQSQCTQISKQNEDLEAQNEEVLAQKRALEESALRTRTIIANIPGAVYRSKYDRVYSMTFISEYIKTLSGYSARDFLSNVVLYGDIILPQDREMVDQTISESLKTKTPFSIDYRIMTKNEAIKWVREHGRGVYDEAGQILRIGGVILDIDEQKRIERLREDIERTVRHDLKNPLAGIIGFSSLLSDDNALDGEAREYLMLIQESGRKMLHMINNSLDLFKMEEGSYVFTPVECDLVSILKRILLECSERFRSKKLKTHFICDGSTVTETTLVSVSGEEYNLETLFSNLIANAAEASPESKPIDIEIETGELVTVRIHNYGTVPEEIRSTFFSRYVTSGKKNGTGLGTYSARLIARVHGGDITFDSSDETGTTLTVTLPGVG